MFDLPVKTKQDRKRYTEFRRLLLNEGFSMLQFSVYARFCASEEIAQRYRDRIHDALPPSGHVRLLSVTERQFARMANYVGKLEKTPEKAPEQISFF